jgi:hypothetical protein
MPVRDLPIKTYELGKFCDILMTPGETYTVRFLEDNLTDREKYNPGAIPEREAIFEAIDLANGTSKFRGKQTYRSDEGALNEGVQNLLILLKKRQEGEKVTYFNIPDEVKLYGFDKDMKPNSISLTNPPKIKKEILPDLPPTPPPSAYEENPLDNYRAEITEKFGNLPIDRIESSMLEWILNLKETDDDKIGIITGVAYKQGMPRSETCKILLKADRIRHNRNIS